MPVVCSASANALIAAKSVKPKGLLTAEQYTGDVKTSVSHSSSSHRKESGHLTLRGWRRHWLGCWDWWCPSVQPTREDWRHGLALKEISDSEWHFLPPHGSWSSTRQVQPLNAKSIHNHRVTDSAAWSHVVMVLPNLETCYQWHWEIFFPEKGASRFIFCFFSTPCLLQERPSDTRLTLYHVGFAQLKAQRALSKPYGKGLRISLKSTMYPQFSRQMEPILN